MSFDLYIVGLCSFKIYILDTEHIWQKNVTHPGALG